MKNTFLSTEFFLSANTTEGFFSAFEYLYYPCEDWFCYILKGGPGTGKSTLMKKLASAAIEKNIKTESIHCSSDPYSLDALIFPELKISIADGTSPHTLDPIYPGATDAIINLGEYWDKKSLAKSSKKIINLCKENSDFHRKSKKYLSAYGTIFSENSKIVKNSINYPELDTFCSKLSKKLLKKTQKFNPLAARQEYRFISSVTPQGYLSFDGTLFKTFENVFIIEDNYIVLGSYILQKLRKDLLDKGHHVIVCPSPFMPSKNIEALFVPTMNCVLAIKSSRQTNKISQTFKYKKINTKKFLDSAMLSQHKNLLSFNKKFCKALLSESVKNLDMALTIHNEIENLYQKNMNYTKINKITDKLISAIF